MGNCCSTRDTNENDKLTMFPVLTINGKNKPMMELDNNPESRPESKRSGSASSRSSGSAVS